MSAKLTYTHEADFRRERDFGNKISATFEFIGAQFRPLLKCLAYFVLPGALLGGMGLGLAMDGVLGLMPKAGMPAGQPMEIAQGYGNNPFTGVSMVGLGLGALGFLVAFLLLSSTVYAFIRVRIATPPNEVVQPAQVWRFMWPRLGRVLLAWLLLAGLTTAGFGIVGTTLALIGPGFVFLLFFPLMWVAVCLTLYFPALWLEDGGVAYALQRSFYLIKGKWWSSLGLYIVMTFITGALQYIFIIPMYGLMAARTLLHVPGADSSILTIAAMSLYALGWIFTAVLPLVAMVFQYFNLVERREGLGLRLLVNSLGQQPALQAGNLAYRPDEEGEY